MECASKVCAELGINHKVVDISAINQLIGGSSLTSDIEVPEGHYAADNMKSTVVAKPQRMILLYGMAVGYRCGLTRCGNAYDLLRRTFWRPLYLS
ncbi:MAG: 7-cyano-7-deazaguanine synthase [Rheinheimera sp.]|nr:7-cyano-7-deazaguanine synthase [Rheinheimera sp.]